VTVKSMRWAATTLLSRAFNLTMPHAPAGAPTWSGLRTALLLPVQGQATHSCHAVARRTFLCAQRARRCGCAPLRYWRLAYSCTDLSLPARPSAAARRLHGVRPTRQRRRAELSDSDVFPEQILSLVEKQAFKDADVEAERVLALVPWADLLNHSSAASERSILQYDETNDAAVCFAHRDYSAGDEVFDSYGRALTPSELLLDYGFVDTKNKISAVTVRWRPLRARNYRLLQNIDRM
jgi:SET domain